MVSRLRDQCPAVLDYCGLYPLAAERPELGGPLADQVVTRAACVLEAYVLIEKGLVERRGALVPSLAAVPAPEVVQGGAA